LKIGDRVLVVKGIYFGWSGTIIDEGVPTVKISEDPNEPIQQGFMIKTDDGLKFQEVEEQLKVVE